jgi:hypothetical protein
MTQQRHYCLGCDKDLPVQPGPKGRYSDLCKAGPCTRCAERPIVNADVKLCGRCIAERKARLLPAEVWGTRPPSIYGPRNRQGRFVKAGVG